MIPANSSPRVGPAKPFSTASSGKSPMVNITSRKLSPVAMTRASISPLPRDRAVFACQTRLLSLPGTAKSRRQCSPAAADAASAGRSSPSRSVYRLCPVSRISSAPSGSRSSLSRRSARVGPSSRTGTSSKVQFRSAYSLMMTRPSPLTAHWAGRGT